MRINKVAEKGHAVLYRRVRGHETNVPLYMLYNFKEKKTLAEFRSIVQARVYMRSRLFI